MDISFVADENTDKHIVQRLKQSGYRVTYVAESNPGIPDEEVLELTNKAGSILMTSDKDFGELVFRQRRVTAGVVLVRVHAKRPQEKAEIVIKAIEEHAEDLQDAFTVITETGVRIRKTL